MMRDILSPGHLILILILLVLIMGVLLVFGLLTLPFRAKRVATTSEGPAAVPANPSLKMMLFGIIVLLFALLLAGGGGLLHILGDLIGVIGLGLGIAGLRR